MYSSKTKSLLKKLAEQPMLVRKEKFDELNSLFEHFKYPLDWLKRFAPNISGLDEVDLIISEIKKSLNILNSIIVKIPKKNRIV